MTVPSIRFPSVVSQVQYKQNMSKFSKTRFQINFFYTSSGDQPGLLFNVISGSFPGVKEVKG